MVEEIFDIYMMARVERYDPAVVRREMSNKKMYLYDNGFASAMNYAFSEDRGKLLENLAFRQLREMTEDIYFLRNGWECDFAAFGRGLLPLIVQVTAHLTRDNLHREVKGLLAAKDYIKKADALLIVQSADPGLEIPEGIRIFSMQDWLLSNDWR
jgi:predicted AAA+ superfamily ATPase